MLLNGYILADIILLLLLLLAKGQGHIEVFAFISESLHLN